MASTAVLRAGVVWSALALSAAPALAQTETFRYSTAPGWVIGGVARLTAAGPDPIDPEGEGWLRLTSADPVTREAGWQGYAYYDTPINPTVGLHVEFEYAIYGGSGGDGLTFFLFDGTTPITSFQVGAGGGSLGYAQTEKSQGGSAQQHGLDKAFLGVGVDTFGDFSNPTEGRIGGPGHVPDAVALRGPGNSFAGYDYVVGTTSLVPGIGTGAGRPIGIDDPNYRRVIVDLTPIGDDRYTVRVVLQQGRIQRVVIAPTEIPQPGWNAKPENLKFGFAATISNDGTDIHEIRLFSAAAPVDLAISKAMQSLVGDSLTYTVTVTNTGPATDPSASVSDPGVAGLTDFSWTCAAATGASCASASGQGPLDTTASVAAGATVTYTVTGRLTPLATSPLVNTATVSPSASVTDVDLSNNVATATATLSTDLTITKTAMGAYVPGRPFTYQVTIENRRALWVYGARVTDSLVPGLDGVWQCVVVTPPAVCQLTPTTAPLDDVVDLGPNAVVRYTLTVDVPSAQAGALVNTATVALPATWVDTNPADNTAVLTSQAGPRADLSVSKSSTPKPHLPGAGLSYTIVVSNAGPSDVSGAAVQDTLPASVTGVTWTCSGANGGVCPSAGTGPLNELVTLPAGSSVTFHLTGTAPSTVSPLQNTVTVTPPSGATDPVPGNNSHTDSNPALPLADLAITKSVAPNPYVPGQPLHYTVTVTNLGPTDVTDARVQDALPPELVASSFTWTCVPSSSSATCVASGSGSLDTLVSLASGTAVTFTLSGPAPDTPLGPLVNAATVTPPLTVTDLVPGNNIATSTAPAPFTANLRLEKTSAPSPYIPGATLTTTITVTNEGPDGVEHAHVIDVPPPALGPTTWHCSTTEGGRCVPETGSGQIDAFVTLPTGGVATFSMTGTAPETVGETLVNTATVTPPPDVVDPDLADNDQTHANPSIPGPDLALTKAASASSYVPGQPLTYVVTVTNNGPIAAVNARVRDTLPPALAGFTWTCAGVSGGATCGTAAGVGTVDAVVTLPVTGAGVRFVVSGMVPVGARGPIVSAATVTVPSGQTDPVPANNRAASALSPEPQPDLRISKHSVPLVMYRPGEPLAFALLVTNDGEVTVPANGYTVTDSLPVPLAGALWTCTVRPTGACSVVGRALTTGELPALAPGASLLITLRTIVPNTVVTLLTNTASTTLTAPGLVDRDLTNNTDTIVVFASALGQIEGVAIDGVVTDSDGAPLAGVLMQLSGGATEQTITASDGSYAFPGLPLGHDYTVAPAPKVGYVFSPASRTFPELAEPARADFVGVVEPYRRYYSEGASGPFFSTTYALTNPGVRAANVSFRFQRPDAPEVGHSLTLRAGAHVVFDPATVPGMESTAFSTVIEADRRIVSARTMVWDRSGYGTHRGMGVGSPRTQWYIAEGATLPRFSLFYLVQNPGDTTATVTVRYLLQAGDSEPIERAYIVAPRSRYTIAVHDEPALVNQELSAEIVSDVPVVVERAMYRSGPRTFEAGAAVTAAPAPVPHWFFAEGATGRYFEMFLLLANPGANSVRATVQYLLPDGGRIVRQHDVPAAARRTVWVDFEHPQLADTAVGIVIDASGPIVAERAMWWAGSDATWTGGTASLGSTYVAPRWGVSGLEAGGAANTEPWILVANPHATPTTIRMTLIFQDGRPNVVADYPVAPQSRLTIAVGQWHPETANASFGAIIEQIGEPTGIVVESAVYSDSGAVTWAAGRGGLATPIP